MTTLPLPPEDRFFLLFDEAGPQVCSLLLLRLEGELPDEAALRAAWAAVARVHLRLRARLGADAWIVDEAVHPEGVVVGPPADDAAALLRELAGWTIPLTTGPVIRLVVRPPFVVVQAHHALGDGMGMSLVLRDLGDHLRGAPAIPLAPRPPEAPRAALWGLLGFMLRGAWRTRLAEPHRVHTLSGPAPGPVDIAVRAVPLPAGPDRTARLVAAWARALARHAAEAGRPCGTLRFMVNHGLRPEPGGGTLDNRSAAVPVWVAPADREAGLLERVRAQLAEGARHAGAARLLAGLLRLPGLGRLIVAAARRPRGADTLLVSHMGRAVEGIRLGDTRVVEAHGFVRPAEGVGALAAAWAVGHTWWLDLSYLRGALSPETAEHLLELVSEELA